MLSGLNFFKKNDSFILCLALITAAGGVLRLVNIQYASLWADELYSMLSVYPGNSWYEILYMQRTYQPPAYFMLLWQWTKWFGHTEYAARLLSVLGGLLAIILTAFLGKKIKNNRLGLALACVIAFNPTQILYSLEARFYIFAYCMAVISLLMHLHISDKKQISGFVYFIFAVVNATLCYFHQFGIFFVFALFVYDLYWLTRTGDRFSFYKKTIAYFLSALLYAPWVFWGLIHSLKVKEFWLKEIDIWKFLTFGLGYEPWMNILAAGMILFFVVATFRNSTSHRFIIIILNVTGIPFIYSLIKFPILVDRYGMVMAPAVYILFVLSLSFFSDKIKNMRFQQYFWIVFLVMYAIPAIHMTWFNKDRLVKQPWREMAGWLKKQPDYTKTDIYALGFYLKNRFTLDFYLLPDKKTRHMNDLMVGEASKIYLVETNSVWKIQPDLLHKVNETYDVSVVRFNEGHAEFGNIYVCTKKQILPDASR